MVEAHQPPYAEVRMIEAVQERPQTPAPPFPYAAEEVRIQAGPGVVLAGTLTLPEGPGPHPAAVLLTGSGAQDRDETLFGHKPFAVIADALTRRGVAVLRYDDRGFAQSTGDLVNATSADFADDAGAALAWLAVRPDIDAGRIGFIGHSEGGVVAPLAVEEGAEAAWVAMIAGPAVSGEQLITAQQLRLNLAAGMPEAQARASNAVQARVMAAVAANATDSAATDAAVTAALVEAGLPQAQAAASARAVSSPWFRWYVAHDPSASLRALPVPLLALYGGRDLQVPADLNAEALRAARPDAEIVVLPGLNHLMQTAVTGQVAEYATIEQTMAPEALAALVEWVVARSAP